jgi:ComF family protein
MAAAAIYASIKSLLKLVFPPECCHCKKPHDQLGVALCKTCISYLEVRPSTGGILVTFEGIGPAGSLMSSLKKTFSPQVASILAAYMAIQYAQSELPLPDLITAVPSSWWRKWQVGGDCAACLAKELAKLLERPFLPLLQRRRQLLRQDFLTREERACLSSEEFQWRIKKNLSEKTILLVDDTVTTGTTLACCAERLWEASPAQIIKMACVDQGYLQE